MTTTIQQTVRVFAIFLVAVVANLSAIISVDAAMVSSQTQNPVFATIVPLKPYRSIIAQATENISAPKVVDTRAERIEAYFGKWNLPLGEHSEFLVEMADKYNLDWRLLPAIGMRETTGGKFACYNNPFGWGSCKIKFDTFEEAIETLARNLGGENPKTASYYKNKTTEEKLYYYNGTVVPSYPSEVVKIMDRIQSQSLES
jgi:hypothetical protein